MCLSLVNLLPVRLLESRAGSSKGKGTCEAEDGTPAEAEDPLVPKSAEERGLDELEGTEPLVESSARACV